MVEIAGEERFVGHVRIQVKIFPTRTPKVSAKENLVLLGITNTPLRSERMRNKGCWIYRIPSKITKTIM